MSHDAPFVIRLMFFIVSSVACLLVMSGNVMGAVAAPDSLPEIKELPDPFALPGGGRVTTHEQWMRHRADLKSLIQTYEYGHLPPVGKVTASDVTTVQPDGGPAQTHLTLNVGPDAQVPVKVIITAPQGKGRFPAIIKGDLCWGPVDPKIVEQVVQHGYVLVEFDRTNVAPDAKEGKGGVLPLFPDSDCATLGAWAWGFHRVIDYLATRPDIDMHRIAVTGHSRGGKAALLAGAMDERIALTCPNGSGCGGAGCYRFQGPHSEDIGAILKNFSYWFQHDFGRFIGKVDRLPFDQHTVKSLVAPRALFSTDSLDDLWANPQGTQQTFLAAREVYKFFGADDNIGLHFRHGKHEQNAEDWAALLHFADHILQGRPAAQDYHQLPFPDAAPIFSFTAPKAER